MYHNEQQEQAASTTTQKVYRCLKELKQLTQPPPARRRRNNQGYSIKNPEPLPQQKHTLTSPSQNTVETSTELRLSSKLQQQKDSSSSQLSSKDNNIITYSQSINASSKLDCNNSNTFFTRKKRTFKSTNNFYMHQNKYDSETSSENYEQISGQYSSSTSSTCKVQKSQQQKQKENIHSKVLDQSVLFEQFQDSLSNLKGTSQASINSQNIVLDAQIGAQDQKKLKVDQNHNPEYLQKRLQSITNSFRYLREKNQDFVESETSSAARQISKAQPQEQMKIVKQNGYSNSNESQYYSNDNESTSYQSENENQIQIEPDQKLHSLQQAQQTHKNLSRDCILQSNPILKKSIKKDPQKQPTIDKQKRNLNAPNQNSNYFLNIHKTQKQSHRFSIQGNISAKEDKKDQVSSLNQQSQEQKAATNQQERKYYIQNPEIDNYVGNEYQAVIPDIIPGYCPKLYVLQYDHSKVSTEEFDKLMQYLHKTFGKYITQEEATKLIIEAGYNMNKVYHTLETGKDEYQFYFTQQKRLNSQKKGQIKRLKTLKNKRRNILTL
ncbi:hypothetical protein ABPG74_021137 [Tetrahymena malaccensis]